MAANFNFFSKPYRCELNFSQTTKARNVKFNTVLKFMSQTILSKTEPNYLNRLKMVANFSFFGYQTVTCDYSCT